MSLLTSLDRSRFELGLTLTYPTEALERHFRELLPPDVKLHVLASEAWLSHGRQLKMGGPLGRLGKV
ncbi:hypothetical protein [Ralstonia sp. UBA689]|uniref:hypothetical protein n=1 Tax=Ralstonia sp. UBA689 TaxID=1947373 RepID=UPI0025FEFE78|nr:hypothetical protein [Ralstonia sp. UBA689]